MKPFLLSVILLFCLPSHAQTTLDDYRRDVTEYSRRLKVAAAGSDAAAEAVGQARTGYLPRLSLDGNFTATVHHYDGVERWNFSVLPQLVQVVYGGGAVRAAYRQAELGYDIALCDEEFTRLDVRYTAEYTYWNLSAMALYAASMRQYVGIIRSLKEGVDRRFAEGYIAKGDVLMIDTRLSEAQYELISAERNYTVALHNFNILMGEKPDAPRHAADSITQSVPPLQEIAPEEAVPSHPSYLIAGKQIDLQRYNVRLAASRFNPQLSAGVQGIWNTPSPNYHGQTRIDGLAFLRLNIPIFHWNERRHTVHAAEATLRSSQYAQAAVADNLSVAISNAWTNITEANLQIATARSNLDVARENLSLNTFSYNEGVLTILDVISAQLSWLQAYTNAVTAHFNEKVAISAYKKAIGRYDFSR